MDRAFDEVVDQLPDNPRTFTHKGKKTVLSGRRTTYRSHREEVIARLTKEIADGTFRVKGYREMEVKDGPYETLGLEDILS